MAVKIRLKRMGKIHAPFYRVVVVDARKKRDGKVIEEIGTYDPLQEPSVIKIDSERVQYWLSVGAQPSDPVRRQLHLTGDWAKFKGRGNTEGSLKVKEVSAEDVQKSKEEAIEQVQSDAEKRRAEKAEARAAAAKEEAEAQAADDADADEAPADSDSNEDA